MSEDMTLGKFIAMRRTHVRLTQEEMAERIGVSKSAVAKWEIDGGLPDRDNLKKLSEVINVSVNDLHRIIDSTYLKAEDLKINITPEVISILESYGYKVIRPGGDDEGGYYGIL